MTARPPSDYDRASALERLSRAKARPAFRPPPRAGAAAARVLKPVANRFGPGLSELTEHWPEVVGARLAKLARPERLTRGKTGGVLTLLARGPAATLLQAESARIIERANLYCGAGTVARLVVRQGPLHDPGPARAAAPPRPLSAGLTPSQAQSVKDGAAGARSPELRGALERLGQAVLGQAPPGERG